MTSTGRAAWEVYQAWLRLSGVALHPEPPGLDRYLAEWADGLGRGRWTDVYLAAFALAGFAGWWASMGTLPDRQAWSF